MEKEAKDLIDGWFSRFFWLTRHMDNAGHMTISSIGSYREGARPPDNLLKFDGFEFVVDSAIGDLQQARFDSLSCAGWTEPDPELVMDESRVLVEAVNTADFELQRVEVFEILEPADQRWFAVQDRLRSFRRGYILATDDPEMPRLAAELEADAVRLQQESAVLARIYEDWSRSHKANRRLPTESSNPEWRPADWFGKTLGQRVRQASQPSRKGKRVRRTEVDGGVLYSLSDARRWWPGEVAKLGHD